MRTYDVNCPCCGHRNNAIYLEETEGWMECEKCGKVVQAANIIGGTFEISAFGMDDHNTTIKLP